MPEDNRYQPYEVLKQADGTLWELGRGAMGITYKAYDTRLHRAVALKVINANHLESEGTRQRFVREARATAALRHENVASISTSAPRKAITSTPWSLSMARRSKNG
jgi:serine/threonine protein kinase